jgi:polysaccharide export outer membrane protein
MSDGSIYGAGFGQLKLQGRTWQQAQQLLRARMKPFRREQDVFLAFKKQRSEFAYVVGSNSPGPVELPASPVTIRQLLPPLTEKQDGQRLDVEVVRAGRTLARTDYARLLQRDEAVGNMIVQPGDLISIVPQSTLRVWVLGSVKSPGQVALPQGTDLYQAVASAGGLTRLDAESTVILRHGPEVKQYPSKGNPTEVAPQLSDGDVITVVAPEPVRITVAGEVGRPGEYEVLDNASILSAISAASGALPTGNLADVLVYRNGELLQLDLTGKGGTSPRLNERIRSGDTVVVREKTRVFYVFGEVRSPGRFVMDEHKTYRVSDALALAGGLSEQGTFRRVYLMRQVPNGKPEVRQFNLDEFLKDGKLESNPELQPGDSLLFGQPRGLTLSAISQILSTYVVVNSVTRR